jgi:hypothetical protein
LPEEVPVTSQASFTTHAFLRVRARLSLTTTEVAELLDSDRVVLIGHEKNSPRIHRLFYSKRDNYCFVAVQDETTGEVVTVVPADYRKAFMVSEEATEMAKRIVLGPPVPRPDNPAPECEEQEISLRFTCKFSCQGEEKEVKLGVCVVKVEKPLSYAEAARFDLIGRPEIREWLSVQFTEHVPADANEKKLYVRFKWSRKKTHWMHVKGFFEEEFL